MLRQLTKHCRGKRVFSISSVLRSSPTSGALSGFTSAILLQPLDVLKTRVQQDTQGRVAGKVQIPGLVRSICAREGVVGLWRGTIPTLLRYVPPCPNVIFIFQNFIILCVFVCLFFVLHRNVPGQALYLTSVQQVRDAIGRMLPSFARTKDAAGERLTTLVKLTPTGNLVAGAVTRTAIGFVVNPLTVVKARFEVRTRCALELAFDVGEQRTG